jgi:hypothetical protein
MLGHHWESAEGKIVEVMAGPTGAGPTGGSSTAAGARTAEDRIAVLQHLQDHGLLTESEFQAQRQRIISEI